MQHQREPYSALPNWIGGQATGLEIAVLWALQYHAPNIHPSFQRLADVAGLSKRTVIKVVGDLERKGWVERIKRAGDGSGREPNAYVLRIWGDDGRAMLRKPLRDGQSAGDALGKVQEMHSGGQSAGDAPPKVQEMHSAKGAKCSRRTRQSAGGAHKEEEINPLGFSSKAETPVSKQEVSCFNQYILRESSSQAAPAEQPATPAQHDDARQVSGPATPVQPAAAALPPCAEPHRDLVVAWWRARCRRHPKAPKALTAADLTAMEYADAQGVLAEFLQDAAATASKTLGHAYRARVEKLLAGSAVSADFERFRTSYMAIDDKACSQSVSTARALFTEALRRGRSADQIISGLHANVRAHVAAQRAGRFAPTFPDMARWLKEARYDAYKPQEGASAPVQVGRPAGPVIDGVQMPF